MWAVVHMPAGALPAAISAAAARSLPSCPRGRSAKGHWNSDLHCAWCSDMSWRLQGTALLMALTPARCPSVDPSPQLPGMAGPSTSSFQRPQGYHAPSAAAAAEAAMQMPGAPPGIPADWDALMPSGPMHARPPPPPPEFAEFEGIYNDATARGGMGMPPPMGLEAAVAPSFKVGGVGTGWVPDAPCCRAAAAMPYGLRSGGCWKGFRALQQECCFKAGAVPKRARRPSWRAARRACPSSPCPCRQSSFLSRTRCREWVRRVAPRFDGGGKRGETVGGNCGAPARSLSPQLGFCVPVQGPVTPLSRAPATRSTHKITHTHAFASNEGDACNPAGPGPTPRRCASATGR